MLDTDRVVVSTLSVKEKTSRVARLWTQRSELPVFEREIPPPGIKGMLCLLERRLQDS